MYYISKSSVCFYLLLDVYYVAQSMYICHIYIYYSFWDICMPLLESMLLSVFANPSRNWAFQRFARVAEKERTQRNK